MSHMGPENSLRHSQTRASSRRTPAHASRRQAQHCRPLSKPQNARQTTAVNDEKSRPYLDVGSGGGLPALPLLALQPERRLTLVEARRRKATFLRSALHELSISGCAVFDERLEQLVGREAFEPFYAAWSLATFTPAEWLGRAAPLVARSGTVFVFIAGEELDQALEHHELELCQKHHWELADGRKRQLLAFQRL
ncbi:MAG: hypothetical protein CSB49_00800 [Proteobacteria bacterium]|nr:MAG: hypothetical protein CSB49_00800 [Pseudomonadota bacterium]